MTFYHTFVTSPTYAHVGVRVYGGGIRMLSISSITLRLILMENHDTAFNFPRPHVVVARLTEYHMIEPNEAAHAM